MDHDEGSGKYSAHNLMSSVGIELIYGYMLNANGNSRHPIGSLVYRVYVMHIGFNYNIKASYLPLSVQSCWTMLVSCTNHLAGYEDRTL